MTSTAITAPAPLAPGGAPSAAPGRLVLVELRRYAARAGVRWLTVGMVAVVLLTAFAAWRGSRPPSQTQLDQAQRYYEQSLDDWQQHGQEQLDSCQEQQEQAQQTEPNVDFGCDQMVPRLDMFLPHQSTFAESAQGWVDEVGTFVLLLSLIVGATFVAAEFSTGAITTWLTFEPRRVRVFGSKVVVVTVVTGVVALLVAALAIGACWAATAVNHATGDMTDQLWTDLGNRAGRAAAAAAGAALLGAALAFLLRHTAAAIAVVIGWFVAIDSILVAGLLGAQRWTVQINLQAWLQAGTTYYHQGDCTVASTTGETVCDSGERALSMTSGGLSLLVLVAVVTALALLVFRRRDVA